MIRVDRAAPVIDHTMRGARQSGRSAIRTSFRHPQASTSENNTLLLGIELVDALHGTDVDTRPILHIDTSFVLIAITRHECVSLAVDGSESLGEATGVVAFGTGERFEPLGDLLEALVAGRLRIEVRRVERVVQR